MPNTVNVHYSDITGCEVKCPVVGAGDPFPFIVDYPGLSPANSADLMGLQLGVDKVTWVNLLASAIFWFVLLMLINVFLKKKDLKTNN